MAQGGFRWPQGTPSLLKFLCRNGGDYLGGTLYPADVVYFVTSYASRKRLLGEQRVGNETKALIHADDELREVLEGRAVVPVDQLEGIVQRRCEEAKTFLIGRYENHPETIEARRRCRVCQSGRACMVDMHPERPDSPNR